MEDYWDLVLKQNAREEETYLEVSQLVYTELGLDEQVFTETQQHYLMQREYQQIFYTFQMQEEMKEAQSKRIQTNKVNNKKYTKDDVLGMIRYSEDLKADVL